MKAAIEEAVAQLREAAAAKKWWACGCEWREEAHERNWREREERWGRGEGRGCPPGLAKQGRC